MRRIKHCKTAFFIVLFTLVLTLTTIAQYTLTDDDVVVTNGIIESCSYNFAVSDIIIPETLDGQTVIGIVDKGPLDLEGVFMEKGITSILLPITMEYIGKYAFEYNKLTSVDLSSCTALKYIGNYAFCLNSIQSIDLSACSALIYIGRYAFEYNPLTSFILPINSTDPEAPWRDANGTIYNGGDEVNILGTSYTILVMYTLTDADVVVNNGFIESCSYNFEFKGIKIPETLDGQTIIGIADKGYSDGIFTGKGIISILLPPTIEHIGDYAFYYNNLLSIDLSAYSALTYIGDAAFSINTIESIDLSACSALTYIGNNAFGINLPSFTLPINVTNPESPWLGANGIIYNGGDEVEDLDISYSLLVMYTLTDSDVVVIDGIIESCSYNFEFTGINIPDTLDGHTIIGIADGNPGYMDGVFCSKGIIYIVLPPTIEKIGINAFKNNNIFNLSFSNCPALTYIGDGAFEYNNLYSVDYSNCIALTYIGDNAFVVNSIKELDLSNCPALTSIGEDAFGANDLTSIDFSNCSALNYIGDGAFQSNELTSIDLSNCTSLDSIFSHAFSNNSISSINLSNCSALTYIGDGAFSSNPLISANFSGCSALTFIKSKIFITTGLGQQPTLQNLILSNCSALESIENYEFENNKLRNLDLSNCSALKSIGKCAFSANFLTSVNLSGCSALTSIGEEAFYDNSITSLNLSDCSALKSIGIQAFYNNSLRSLDLSDCSALFSIGYWAFRENNLKSVNFNNCVALTSIDYHAFYFNYLTELDLNDCISLTYIGMDAFGFNDLKNFNLPTPIIPGFSLDYWVDGKYNTYPGGDSVSNFSTSYTAILTTATDIYEFPENRVRLYPNPVKDIINLQITEDAIVSIMDLSGNIILVQEVKKGNTSISVNHIIHGLYIFKIETKNKIFLKKIIINC